MSIAEKLKTIAENEQRVFDAGKQTEYDTFWDNYQNLGYKGVKDSIGMRSDYRYAFANQGWRDSIYDPKYSIKVGGNCEGMYQLTGITKKVVVNMSGCTSARTMFYYARVKELGELDLGNCKNTQYLLSNATSLVSIDKIKCSEATTWHDSTFEQCGALTHVIFNGEIAKNSLNLKDSTGLDKESIVSVINCLSAATTDLGITLSEAAVKKAFETAVGANDGDTSAEWITIRDTKTNWTISLS